MAFPFFVKAPDFVAHLIVMLREFRTLLHSMAIYSLPNYLPPNPRHLARQQKSFALAAPILILPKLPIPNLPGKMTLILRRALLARRLVGFVPNHRHKSAWMTLRRPPSKPSRCTPYGHPALTLCTMHTDQRRPWPMPVTDGIGRSRLPMANLTKRLPIAHRHILKTKRNETTQRNEKIASSLRCNEPTPSAETTSPQRNDTSTTKRNEPIPHNATTPHQRNETNRPTTGTTKRLCRLPMAPSIIPLALPSLSGMRYTHPQADTSTSPTLPATPCGAPSNNAPASPGSTNSS